MFHGCGQVAKMSNEQHTILEIFNIAKKRFGDKFLRIAIAEASLEQRANGSNVEVSLIDIGGKPMPLFNELHGFNAPTLDDALKLMFAHMKEVKFKEILD